jgi:hypothetical protein
MIGVNYPFEHIPLHFAKSDFSKTNLPAPDTHLGDWPAERLVEGLVAGDAGNNLLQLRMRRSGGKGDSPIPICPEWESGNMGSHTSSSIVVKRS